MNMKKLVASIITIIVCIPIFSFAHPGHGETGGYTIVHYLTEPVHAVIAMGVLIAVAAYIRQLRKSKQTK